jgi:uncharacterized protein
LSVVEKRPDRVRGPGHDDFWAWCGRGELRIQRCARCNRLSWPVVQVCEHCGSGELVWDQVSGRGKIVSWCTFERDYSRGLLPLPWESILVELDEGAMMISNPLGLTWRDLELHMPVKVAFLDCEDASGAFKLPVFERA